MVITKVIIHYTVAGPRVLAQVRTYADALAVREETITLDDAALTQAAIARLGPPGWLATIQKALIAPLSAAGRAKQQAVGWTEFDLCDAVPDAVWRTSDEARAVIIDIAPEEGLPVEAPVSAATPTLDAPLTPAAIEVSS